MRSPSGLGADHLSACLNQRLILLLWHGGLTTVVKMGLWDKFCKEYGGNLGELDIDILQCFPTFFSLPRSLSRFGDFIGPLDCAGL